MSRVILKVIAAGPLVSIQDTGRTGLMRYGVPRSGPMDRLAYAAAHGMLSTSEGPAIEISLGGLALECVEGTLTCAVAGGGFRTQTPSATTTDWTCLTLTPGDRTTISAGAWGSWCYLAFAGCLRATSWLGSVATHGPSGLGGGLIKTGDILTIEDAMTLPDRLGDTTAPKWVRPTGRTCVVIGPQEARFESGATDTLCTEEFTVTEAYDRMGMRLSGPPLPLGQALSIPSEPILKGSIQVSGDGIPTILLADHQTTGGYPKIATVMDADLDRLSQQRAGDRLRFSTVSPEQAVHAAREYARHCQNLLSDLAAPRLSMGEKLHRANLISGAIAEGDDR